MSDSFDFAIAIVAVSLLFWLMERAIPYEWWRVAGGVLVLLTVTGLTLQLLGLA